MRDAIVHVGLWILDCLVSQRKLMKHKKCENDLELVKETKIKADEIHNILHV
jgi:hypothetical protein